MSFHENSVYVLNSHNSVLQLDIQSGKLIKDIKPKEIKGDIKWMRCVNGVIYFMSGEASPPIIKGTKYTPRKADYSKKSIDFGLGKQLSAYDINRDSILWTYDSPEIIDSSP